MNKKEETCIYDNALVKTYIYGQTIEMTTGHGINTPRIKILPNKRYLDLITGEIKEFERSSKKRIDNLEVVKQTMKKLRRLIANNFTGGKNQLWVTLTYKKHVTDYKEASKDYKAFMKRVRKKYGGLDYISVIEPQASGRWHFHILMKNDSTLSIPNDTMSILWGKGFTTTKRLKSSDNVANYVIAYLSNLDIAQNDDFALEKKRDNKKYEKGLRLYFYPKGIRIYRRSKGILDPIEITTKKRNILKSYNLTGVKPNYVKETVCKTEDKEVTYITEFYDNIKIRHAIKPTKANDDESPTAIQLSIELSHAPYKKESDVRKDGK